MSLAPDDVSIDLVGGRKFRSMVLESTLNILEALIQITAVIFEPTGIMGQEEACG